MAPSVKQEKRSRRRRSPDTTTAQAIRGSMAVARTFSMEGTSVVRMREFSSPKGFCSRAARRRGESSGRRRASSHFGPMKEKVAAS